MLFLGAVHSNKFLVTAINLTHGVQIRIYNNVNSDRSFEKTELTGYSLPLECGISFQKCHQLAIVSVNRSSLAERSYVAIVPLARALGLLEIKVNSIGFPYISGDPHIIDLSEPKYNCSPTSIYHIQSSHYIVCSNADSYYVKLLELQLNATHIEKSFVPILEYPHLDSVENLTNSLYVALPSQSGLVIFFATGYEVFYFRPLQYVIGELDIDLRGNECFATSIDYIGEWEMLVYCDNNRAVYVDINSESIFATVDFNKDGQPYVCPNPDVYLAVYIEQHYIQYAFRSTKEGKDFQLSGRKFDNGICGGSQNVTLFAFTDKKRGTQLLNASAGSIRSLSDASCINYPCQPLVMLQNQYLVIREKRGVNWYISVLDSDSNFSLVLEAQYTEADLMAIIEDLGSNPSSNTSSNTSDVDLENHITLGGNKAADNEDTKKEVDIAVIVIPLSAILLLMIVGLVLTFLLLLTCRKRRYALLYISILELCFIVEFLSRQNVFKPIVPHQGGEY